MRHFAHHIGDYAAATAHLSWLEDAAYHRLLRRYYQDEKPIPADLERVYRLVGAVSRWEKTATRHVLEEFFTLTPLGYTQSRAEQEINDYKKKANQARTNGVSGGRPRLVSKKKLTMNHEPITNSDTIVSGAKAPARDVIFAEALPWINRRSGKECRSIVARWCHTIGDDETLRLMSACEQENPLDPVAWIAARLKPAKDQETWDQRRIRLGLEAIKEATPS